MASASGLALGTSHRLRATPASIWVLLGGLLLVRAMGFGYLFLTFLLHERGYGPTRIEWALATFGVGWLIGQPLCGWLTDRVGRRRTLVGFLVLGAAGLPVLGTSAAPVAVLAGALLAGMSHDASRPVISAAIADQVPDDGHRAWLNGWRHLVLNAGGALAGGLGGLLAGPLGMPALYWLNAAACGAFTLLVLRYVPADVAVSVESDQERYRECLADARLWILVAASLGALVPLMATYAAVPLLMTSDHLPPAAFGTIQLAASAAVVLLTPLLNPWLSRRAASPRPMLAEVAASSVFLGAAMAGIGFTSTVLGYGLAVVATIPGEVIWFVAISDVLNRIAPTHARGIYNGVWGMSLAGASVLSPLLTAWALDLGGKPMVGATIAAAGLFGAICCVPLALGARGANHPDASRFPR